MRWKVNGRTAVASKISILVGFPSSFFLKCLVISFLVDQILLSKKMEWSKNFRDFLIII